MCPFVNDMVSDYLVARGRKSKEERIFGAVTEIINNADQETKSYNKDLQ